MGVCFGKDFKSSFYRKMPLRLAKRLSAGFQDKESKPQVHIRIHPYTLKDHLKLVNGVGKYCRMKSGAKLSCKGCALFVTAPRKVYLGPFLTAL